MIQPGTSPDGQPLCVWTADSGMFSAHIRPELLRRLAAEAWIGFKRVPRRGLEIGGILLGRMDRRGQHTAFCIDGFELLESEHRSGPSYILSESDLARLDAIIARQGPSCIGIFRSHTRAEQPTPQTADADLLERSSPKRDALLLFLFPVKGAASLFWRSDGILKCVHEFSLASSAAAKPDAAQAVVADTELLKPAPREVRNDALEACDALPADIPPLDTPPLSPNLNLPDGPQQYSRKLFGYDLRNAIWVMAGIAVPLGLVLGTSMFSPSVSRSAARKSNPLPRYLPLTVDQAEKSLTLHWDPQSPAIQNAERAILHIDDGEFQTDRHLAQRDLQDGVFTYQPKSSGVLFQIEIYSQQPSAFGLVQATNVARAPALPPTQSARREARQVSTSSRVEESAPPQDHGIRPDATLKASTPSGTAQPQRGAGTVERSEPASSNLPSLAEAPKEVVVSASPSAVPVPSPAEVGERRPSVDVSTEPVSASRLGRLIEKIPLLRRARKEVRAAPVPIYEAQPSFDSKDAKRIAEPVSIGVRVSVAETGVVKDAEVVDYGEPPNWSAANAALDAARRWTFQPARVEDAAVSSEIILRFRFNP